MVFFRGAMQHVLSGKSRALSAFARHSSAASHRQRLAGKVAVITGGASGIGKATAAEFVRNGARVILADVQDDLGHAVSAELGRDAACYTRCDVTDEAQVAAAIDLAVARYGRLDVVLNNAGISGDLTPAPIGSLDLGDFDRVMAVNARAVVAGVKHAARVMVPRRGGSIICTASTAGVMGGVAMPPYTVAKMAVVGLVRAVAGELGRSGVRVNAISPHCIPTPLAMGAMAKRFPAMGADELRRIIEKDMNEMDGQVLEAEDVAQAALYLASDESKYVNGHNLVVDGGFTVSKSPNMPTPEWIAEDPISSTVVVASEDDAENLVVEEQAKAEVTHNIVFVTGEASPYAKSGGLGDVCGSLPVALAARGHRVMVVMPRYLNGTNDKNYANAFYTAKHIKVPCFGGEHEVTFFHEYRDSVDWVFVDHPSYHRPGNLYGDKFGAFGDNQFRYTLLCYAACEAPLILELGGYIYGQNCMFVVNDWHASLVPVLLAAKYRPYGVYKDARSILVIHNLAHQGVEPASTYPDLGLPPEWYGALEWVFPEWARRHALDKGEAVNFLKGAVVTADRIVTVSKGYSWEVTTAEGGQGLDELLSSRKSVLNGIVNGIDINDWNPATDKFIHSHYSVDDLSGKAECKAALQKELGLPIRPDVPLIGFIGRLDYQKGIDLIKLIIPDLMQDDVQFVMLGSGDPDFEAWMRSTESYFKDKFRGWVGFSVPVSHRITAGCDILLMPSRFEPCGLNQLYAMHYGTVPVVHGTGGLRDTVENFNPFGDKGEQGTGWAFAPLTTENMLWTLRTAISTYREHKSSWEGLMKRGMTKDFTWDHAAEQYEQIFQWAFIDKPYVK